MGIRQDIRDHQAALERATKRARSRKADPRDAHNAADRATEIERGIKRLEASAEANLAAILQLKQLAASIEASPRRSASRAAAGQRILEAMLWLQHDLDHD